MFSSVWIPLTSQIGRRSRFDDLLAVSAVGLSAARRLADRTAESSALMNLGLALYGLRRYDEAVVAQRDATAILSECGDQRDRADALNNLGLAERARPGSAAPVPLPGAGAF